MPNKAHKIVNLSHNEKNIENRIIDLVFLGSQTMGDAHLEKELLQLFDKTAKNCLNIILSDLSNDKNNEILKLNLHSLKGAASAVGAKAIIVVVKQCQAKLQETGFLTPNELTKLGLEVEMTRRYIRKLIA